MLMLKMGGRWRYVRWVVGRGMKDGREVLHERGVGVGCTVWKMAARWRNGI